MYVQTASPVKKQRITSFDNNNYFSKYDLHIEVSTPFVNCVHAKSNENGSFLSPLLYTNSQVKSAENKPPTTTM